MNDKVRYFFPKVKNRILPTLAKFYKYIPIERISLRGIDSLSKKEEFLVRMEKILGANLPDIVRCVSEEDRYSILCQADAARQNIFDVLGSGPVKMDPINWSREIKTQYEWPVGVYYLKLRGLTPQGSDIKVPWEISRCHHLLWMAEAYCLTNDENYATAIIEQIRHWILNNPLMYSVNWTCAMDVSIRAINWMYALSLIGKSKSFTDEFTIEVYRSLYQHLFFVNRNLEKCIPYSNNHYFSDIVGQLFLGNLFLSTRRGKRTFRRAIGEYCREVKTQIFISGVDYERSVSYHRLMTELLLYPYYMLKRNGYVLPDHVSNRLSFMLGYVNQYIIGDGCVPNVSDADNGRLLPLVPRPFTNHGYLIYKDSLENRVAAVGGEWVSPACQNDKSRLYPDANVAILKNRGMYLYVSCFHRWRVDGLIDSYTSTHLHSDLLSFVFADKDDPIIVDAGSFCYTSCFNQWKSFRTAKKHNTLVVDDEEPNILGDDTFMMKYNANAEPMTIMSGEVEHCEGKYTTIAEQMTHRREFDLASDYLKITDYLAKKGPCHNAYMSFHFSKGVEATIEGTSVKLICGRKQYRITFDSQIQLCMRIEEDTISPSFGVIEDTKTLVVEFTFDENAKCVTIIERL